MSSSPSETPLVSVCVVSYNTRDLLRACLTSVEAARDEVTLDVFVVDNASRDGSVEMVRYEFPRVRVLQNARNEGFGRAHNRAFEEACGAFFLLLNSDAELLPGALTGLLDVLHRHPRAGAVGAQLVWPDGNAQPSYGDDPAWWSVPLEQFFADKLWSRMRGAFMPSATAACDTTEARPVEQLNGACLLVRREAWRAVGGFDPRFWMYVEDVDVCRRLRAAGWELWWTPHAQVRHLLGGSSERDWQTRARMVSAYNASRFYFFSRHDGSAIGRLVKGFCVLGAALRLSGWSVLALSRPGAREKVKLFRHVLRATWRMTPHGQPEGAPR